MIINTEWGDLDAFNHINNVAIIRYMQTARVHLCEKLGIGTTAFDNQPAFMVAEVKCQFILPLTHPQKLKVTSVIEKIGTTSFQLKHELRNEANEICSVGYDALVLYDFNQKLKVCIPAELKGKMKSFEIN